MRLFEELDNDLMNVNSVQSLSKVLRANGIVKIENTDNGVEIEVNVYGLINNVPAGHISVLNNKYNTEVGCVENGIKVYTTVLDKETFTRKTGIVLVDVESEGNNEA